MSETAQRSVTTRVLDRAGRDRWIRPATALVMGVLVVLAYAAAVGVERLFGRSGPPGLVPSVMVTAVVAVTFEPIRRRTRRLLTRLAHADDRAQIQVLAGLLDAIGGRYEVAELPAHIAEVVGEGTGADRTEVWLMVGGRLDLAASWSPQRPDGPDPGLPDKPDPGTPDRPDVVAHPEPGDPRDTRPVVAGLRHELDVRDRGDLLGRLVVVAPPDRRLTTGERQLVEGVAAKSGLLLRVAGLRVELQRRLDDLAQRSAELRHARRDLVARQDAERQRLERNIHDGAQQEVIALLVNLRLAQTLLGRSPERARRLLYAQAVEFRSTIETLEDLAGGLYPRALTEDGPVPAVRGAARRSPVPVVLSADPVPRLPADLEATVYFCVVEAMQNTAKHAGAHEIRIDIRHTGESVDVAVTDDGMGFDPADTAAGRGMANIRDRVESVGGRLTVTSSPGGGTRLRFRLPIPGGR